MRHEATAVVVARNWTLSKLSVSEFVVELNGCVVQVNYVNRIARPLNQFHRTTYTRTAFA